jgi:hypothetical protein
MSQITEAIKEPRRSESDVLIKELKLKFGEKEYVVPVLRMRAAEKWRAEYFEKTKEVSDSMPEKFDKENDPRELSKAIGRGLMGALLQFPNKIPELVFSYAPLLPREEVLEAAYDQDFARAYKQIWQVAFRPFLDSLGMVIEMQRSQESASLSRAGSN